MEVNREEGQERVLTWGRVPVVGLPTLHVKGGYTTLRLWTDGYKEFAGFKLEIVPAYPKYYLDKINEKVQVIYFEFQLKFHFPQVVIESVKIKSAKQHYLLVLVV